MIGEDPDLLEKRKTGILFEGEVSENGVTLWEKLEAFMFEDEAAPVCALLPQACTTAQDLHTVCTLLKPGNTRVQILHHL